MNNRTIESTNLDHQKKKTEKEGTKIIQTIEITKIMIEKIGIIATIEVTEIMIGTIIIVKITGIETRKEIIIIIKKEIVKEREETSLNSPKNNEVRTYLELFKAH